MKELRALIRLRWQMTRSRRVRVGLGLLAVLLPVMCGSALGAGRALDASSTEGLRLLAPSTFLAFAVVAVVAPLAAGGGNELFPAEQLVAFPVPARTMFLSSLAVAPLNLVWGSQLIVLFASAGLVTNTLTGAAFAAITTTAYACFVTVAGQVVAWSVVGIRQRLAGRVLTWSLLAVIGVVVAAVTRAGAWARLLDHSPTVRLLSGIAQADQGVYRHWVLRTGLVVLLALVLLATGKPVTAWALRQTAHSQGRQESRPQRRRRLREGAAAQSRVTDRASVWRAPALRRGLIVLAAIPGAVAYLGTATYQQLVLVPGLVAAGAGLLFGVNAFCLDGSGAVWLASQPRAIVVSGRAKLAVTVECCVVAVLLALGGGLLRQSAPPTAAELSALVGSLVANVLIVVAACARWSILRPHRAELRGPRDTPAPPGTMAVYSLRLAASTTGSGLLLSAASAAPGWEVPAAVSVGLAALALLSLRRSALAWSSEQRRALVVATVAAG